LVSCPCSIPNGVAAVEPAFAIKWRTGPGLPATLPERRVGTWRIARPARCRASAAQWDDTPVDDDVLVERVRAHLGRAVSHPHAVDVGAADGVVTLRGPTAPRSADAPREREAHRELWIHSRFWHDHTPQRPIL